MHILVLGAGGFIGRHVVADLLAHGHQVTAVVRRADGLAGIWPGVRLLPLDLARAIAAADWTPHLGGIDAIVNAAGLLRGPAMPAIHVAMPRALYAAARTVGIARVVLLSAISARADVATAYARTKLEGEAELRQSGLDWTILRPSLVYGDGSYGGTSLLRGLAALPVAVPVPGRGDFPFTPIHVADLARCVRLALTAPHLVRCTLEPVGPETMSLRDLLGRYRAWLGFGDLRILPLPLAVLRAIGAVGERLGAGPVASTTLEQMRAGNAGNPTAFAQAIGFTPRALDQALRDRPAQVQDRWHARLFFLAPALKAVLVLMWLASAWLGLTQGQAATVELVTALGLPLGLVAPLQLGSSALDIVIAGLLLLDRTGRWSTPAQVIVVVGYTAVIGWALPGLWLDPLGALMKNLPILVAILVHGAIADRR
ncbi:SDR family oxidoreductase [Zavarzinia sp. CC-PAN008]|uniref:SDR family oxidoreductase n=1 Tax=Zavarzinia sp. CC-PAN008 TaxID=3243332 RepID=UPI003F74816C